MADDDKKKKKDDETIPDSILGGPTGSQDDPYAPGAASGIDDPYDPGFDPSAEPDPTASLDWGQTATTPDPAPFPVPQSAQLGAPQLQLGGQTAIAPPPATSAPASAPQLPNPASGMVAPTTDVPVSPMQAQPYGDDTPPGSLTATPRQAQVESLNNNQAQQDDWATYRQQQLDQAQKVSDIHSADALEKARQSDDYQNALVDSQSRHNQYSQLLDKAYQDYSKAAGSLKDPSQQFWADRSTGSRIMAALALFASGMGASLGGHAGNPMLDYLNKQIENNFDAHKQNIQDLYNKQVAAGHLEDTADSYSRFMLNAKQASYEVASAHIAPQLAAVAAQTTGQQAAHIANQTILGLQQTATNGKLSLAQQEASRAAAQLANARKQEADVRTAFQEALKNYPLLGPDQKRLAAAKEVEALGYDRSLLGPIMGAAGAQFNPKTDTWEFPPPAGSNTSSNTGSDAGVIPDSDPVTGQQYTEAEKDKIRERVVRTSDGGFRMANSKEDGDDYRLMMSATNGLDSDLNTIKKLDAELASDNVASKDSLTEQHRAHRQELIGQYNTITKDMATRYNEAMLGVKRAAPGGESLSEDAIPKSPSTFGGEIGVYSKLRQQHNAGKITALDKIIQDNRASADENYLQAAPKTAPKAPSVVNGASLPNRRKKL